MKVVKRDGTLEVLNRRKIYNRLLKVGGLTLTDTHLNRIVDQVIDGLYDQVTTSDIDEQLALCAANLSVEHSDYAKIANKIALENYTQSLPPDFSSYLALAYSEDLVSETFYEICTQHMEEIKCILKDTPASWSEHITFFALRTLQNGYLLQCRRHHDKNQKTKCFEHPKYMYLRVAIQLFQRDMRSVHRFYLALCENKVTVASPILFSAGAQQHSLQMASCFVAQVPEDSIDGMYEGLYRQAILMKNLGGIGLSVSNIRCRGSKVHSFNGVAAGVVQYLLVVNASCQHISQGAGKRKGALAAFIEPWHGEIYEFLNMRRVDGKEELKARNIFFGLWIPDEFMRRARNNEMWSLMCPHECPGLSDVYGDEFDELYRKYEREGRYIRRVSAQHLLNEIGISVVEAGNPYIMFKDHVNRKSNLKNVDVIRGSNLCSEICLPFNDREVAVCILGAVTLHRNVHSLSSLDERSFEHNSIEFREQLRAIATNVDEIVTGYVVGRSSTDDGQQFLQNIEFSHDYFVTKHVENVYYDFRELRSMVALLVRALNLVIDTNHYALEYTRVSNKMNRPIGIGVQGLADTFVGMGLPFDSLEARLLNRLIFEHIYAAALSESVVLAKEQGPYPRFQGSPMSQGIIQPMMWNTRFVATGIDWPALIEDVKIHGVRNSTLTAIMPTATTAQLWNNNESIEPFSSVVYYRRVLSGQFVVVNSSLMNKLEGMGLWEKVYQKIIETGSIQSIDEIPKPIRDLYKTGWDLPQKVITDMSIDRAPFIDQSQSLNYAMRQPSFEQFSSLLHYSWKYGLKTAIYYLRTKPAFYAPRTAIKVRKCDENCESCSL